MRHNNDRREAGRTFIYSSAQAAIGLILGSLVTFLVGDWIIDRDSRINFENDLIDLQSWKSEHMSDHKQIELRLRKLEVGSSVLRAMNGMNE